MFGRFRPWLLLLLFFALLPGVPAQGERVKDLARVLGVRNNQLVGYGLVVGLAQTGDDFTVPFAQQSLIALLQRMGTVIPPQLMRTRDAAAVMVTALVPPFSKSGSQVDVTVAAIGNARSLVGGVLIATPLRGGDGRVYGVAQGSVLVGGLLSLGHTGSMVQRNHVTTGRIPEGGLLEKDMPSGLQKEALTFLLKNPDFTTANRLVAAFEKALAPQPPKDDNKDDKAKAQASVGPIPSVRAVDAGTVEVAIPPALRERPVALAAQLEELEIEPDQPARIVINERSGIVVIGAHVRLRQAAVSFGRLTVRVDEGYVTSQPNALGRGVTTIAPETKVQQTEDQGLLRVVGPAAKVEDVVRSLNLLGASTRELVNILQSLQRVGALRGELLIE